MSVFDELVGQQRVVEQLQTAATTRRGGARPCDRRGDPARGAMTHAWLFTGPPGSGRSIAARAFAAALQCAADGGCGHCESCHQVLVGTHPDVALVVPGGPVSWASTEAREIVARSSRAPDAAAAGRSPSSRTPTG